MNSPQFPKQLTERRQWLVWRFVQKPGAKKPSKMPYYAISGRTRSGQQGSEEDRASLVDYETAAEVATLQNYDGLGFAFLPDDGLIGIDIDGALNDDVEPARKQRAMKIIEACASYTEYSPSRNGVHIIVEGHTETFKSNVLGIEVFCGRQFFTMSGAHFDGTPAEVYPIADATLQKLRETVRRLDSTPTTTPVAKPIDMDQRTKIEAALIHIPADCGYDEWVKIGMAVHSELGESGLPVWDWWSQRGGKYPGAEEIATKWRSFKAGSVSAGTLFHIAKANGWRPPLPPKQAPQAAFSADPKTGEITAPANDNEESQSNRMVREWAFVAAQRKFIHVPTMRLLDVDAFNLEHLHIMEQELPETKKMKPAEFVRRIANSSVVHDLMYLPTMWNGDPFFTLDGIKYLNTYNANTVPVSDPNWELHDAWQVCLRHIQNIIPDGWEQVLQWLAHNVQHPGKKILWAPVIVGIPGDGKTTLSKMLTAAMGRNHTQAVGPDTLNSDFNGWAEGKCVTTFEEIRAKGHSRHDFMNKLKPLITNEVVDVVSKGKNSRNVINTQNYLALSNFRDALVLDSDDRRWGVFFTRFTSSDQLKRETGAAYWARVNDYAIKEHAAVIRGWLLSVDLSSFDPNESPAMTDAKRFMIGHSFSSDAQSIAEIVGAGAYGVNHDVIETKALNDALKSQEGRPMQTSRMAAALRELGFAKIEKTIKWNGRPCWIWTRTPFQVDDTALCKERIRHALDEHKPPDSFASTY